MLSVFLFVAETQFFMRGAEFRGRFAIITVYPYAYIVYG